MTEDAKLFELPKSGRHVVRTLHASYLFDMDAGTFEARRGNVKTFRSVRCKVRQPMTVTWFETGRLSYINSTPVVSIEPVR